jgi:hypothetical protein
MNPELDHPENYSGEVIGTQLKTKRDSWKIGQKFEYNNVSIDLRQLDQDGTLEVVSVMDKDSCKRIPQVQMVDGHLIIALRREA